MVSPLSAAGAYAKLARLADPSANMPKGGSGIGAGGDSAGPSFGALVKDDLKGMTDLRPNEVIAFVPLVVITLLMGIYPALFLDPMKASVDNLVAQLGAPAAANLAAR